jgi:hypothetical protein
VTRQIASLTSLQEKLRDRLIETRDSHSGGWGEHPGGTLSTLNTAEVILALMSTDLSPGLQPIQSALEFLVAAKAGMLPPDSGAWPRKMHAGGRDRLVPDLMRTCLAITALLDAGTGIEKSEVKTAIEWVLGRQGVDPDTGWAYQRGQKSEILPTCFALLTLTQAAESAETNPWRDKIEKGLACLAKLKNRNGSFGVEALLGAHTAYTCIALQTARSRNFNISVKAESDAVAWLLNNPDDALAPVEEIFTIDPDPSRHANYPFMFTMDALILRVLGNSTDPRHRQTDLWREVQRRLNENFDNESGGLYGRRVFSWSTAAGLYAIKLVERNLKEIPARPAEDPGGTKIGNAILGFAIFLVGCVVYLSATGRFDYLQASVFGLLVLACLLAYGKIGEKTFGQLAPRWRGLRENDGSERDDSATNA